MPPPASSRNSIAECETVSASVAVAAPSITVKTTTATPSLNRDSPTILISMSSGAPALRMMPSTAIGSVGEINAPKTRQ